MSHFPLFIDLQDAPVFLVGDGPQIREKAEKLLPFRPRLHRLRTLNEADLAQAPALVVIGDLPQPEAALYSRLCRGHGIPVNVVDMPALCTFYFPAIIQREDLTVAISTAGKSPGFAACLRRKLESVIPQRAGEILDSLAALRAALRPKGPGARRVLMAAAEQSLEKGRPLTPEETQILLTEE